MAFEWRVPINEILFGLTFTQEITDDTVRWNADSAVRYSTLDLGPQVYYEAIRQALASGETLDSVGQLQQFTEQQIADFLRAMATRLDELRPWPEPQVRQLDATTWAAFGHAVPIAQLQASILDVTDMLQKGFRPTADASGVEVLMLRLNTGEDIALLSSHRRGEKVTVLTDAVGDPAEVIQHFCAATGFPAEKVTGI